MIDLHQIPGGGSALHLDQMMTHVMDVWGEER